MLHTILYIDPGTGSLLYQAVLSGFLTGIFYFKKIKAYFKTGRKKTNPLDNTEVND